MFTAVLQCIYPSIICPVISLVERHNFTLNKIVFQRGIKKITFSGQAMILRFFHDLVTLILWLKNWRKRSTSSLKSALAMNDHSATFILYKKSKSYRWKPLALLRSLDWHADTKARSQWFESSESCRLNVWPWGELWICCACLYFADRTDRVNCFCE